MNNNINRLNHNTMQYQLGNFYTFDFVEKYLGGDGRTYLRLSDPENPDYSISVKPFSFQDEWGDIQSELRCYCSQMDKYGNYRFVQAREDTLHYLYTPYMGLCHKFVIEKRLEDDHNGCIISDEFGLSQHYYPNDRLFWDSHSVGDEIILDIKGIHPSANGRNNAYLELDQHLAVQTTPASKESSENTLVIRDTTKTSLGQEDDHTEFKSSIAYPAGSTTLDMTTQLGVLMRTIAGFMNKEGGTLYIGVNDSGEPYKDISEEFEYLNCDSEDDFKYNKTADHYKLKLNNKINACLGDYAATFASVEFRQANDVTYAAIVVKPCDSVVWYQRCKLYVRCDNSTRRMYGDSITNFVLNRVKLNRFVEIINKPVKEETSVIEASPVTTALPAPAPIIKMQPATTTSNGWRYVSFLRNGQWVFGNKPYDKREDLLAETDIPRNPKSYVLMIAYKSGNVNAVDLKELLYGTGRKQNTLITCGTRNKGVNMNNGEIIKVFVAQKDDLILMESNVNNITYVKAHMKDAITSHNNLDAQGNTVIPEGALLNIAPISNSAQKDSISAMGILVKNYKKYSHNGVPMEKMQGKYQELIKSIFNN